ncbi:GAF domain-containing protein [Mucilaginibacter sp. ZT4R22]|uniref:GAF domain-containing protein n=1 Tax=Mucilaginibacter pankratovii TaxID=2772110 RepID=A0ABR7WJ03_9SPHI|nr:GAF domain-containing protein [Mucilaginibacter pankratovii]MBD1362310.1 GAF domain-containing protein [Mucilaginibacter pankratovii]
MNLNALAESPFSLHISFHKLIEHLEEVAAAQTGPRANYARSILKEVEPFPELRNGITNKDQIINNTEVISHLLENLFPVALTDNEIKAVSIPYQDIIFNQTRRFKSILSSAGEAFNIAFRDYNEHQFYVMGCCIILDEVYGTQFSFTTPLYYDIPTAQGILKHYRILYNADFLELTPTSKAVDLTQDDIELLADNFDNFDLWKEKFPPGSWELRGFGLMSLFDATIESAVSSLKGTLLGGDDIDDSKHEDVESVFRSIYRVPDLRVGFLSFDPDEHSFTVLPFSEQFKSFLLPEEVEAELCSDTLCVHSLSTVVNEKLYFAISDIDKYIATSPTSIMGKRFKEQGINSVILAPVIKNGQMLGIIELVSGFKGKLNSINANQLDVVMPFITDTIDRKVSDMQNRVQAIIQDEYTSIHPSVYWKFKKEANKFLQFKAQHKHYNLKEITFTNVYPLYGQVDIKGSSDTRNNSLQTDLKNQLCAAISLVEKLSVSSGIESLDAVSQRLRSYEIELASALRADTEQQIQQYLEQQVHPIFKQALVLEIHNCPAITKYFEDADKMGDFHLQRRKYETTVAIINERMATMLDKWQVEAQAAHPHYYERFKTDGVEHNLYIGEKIAPTIPFEMEHVHNLRLWQIQVLCEMELEHHFNREILPYPLEVTSLILAFSSPLSIRFRMDEKRFDVDGTYNARFEIVKKRIDKACIKGTTDRITNIGKLTVVYTNHDEEIEYLTYIRFLQSKGMLEDEIEMLEVEDLQGISGLKAIRVKILYDSSLPSKKCYTYQELLQEIDPEEMKYQKASEPNTPVE